MTQASVLAQLGSAGVSQGFKNRIINGAMMIDQRNAGAAVTTDASYPVDRFIFSNSTDGAFSGQQDSSAPAGFVNSLKVTTTTADGTLTTTQNFQVLQRIEGTNVADLGWGTASAKTVTLSFWVRSSLTGTFGGSIRNSGLTRSYAFTYSISVADTWEYKTVTIPGDTSGTWLTTTGTGLVLSFGLGVGPDRSGTAGAWAGANYVSATGAVSVIGTLNATWYITGVQLEVGTTATEFEVRPYGTELALCQRYFEKSYAQGTAVGTATGDGMVGWYGVQTQTTTGEIGISASYKVTKRADPTVVIYDPAGTSAKCQRINAGVASYSNEAITVAGASDDSTLVVYSSTSTNATTGVVCHFTASAEL